MRPLRAIYVSAALFMIGSLAGCGFTPIYGTGSSISQTLSDIQVAPPGQPGRVFVRSGHGRASYTQLSSPKDFEI